MSDHSIVPNELFRALTELLIELFTKDELLRWVTISYGPSLVAQISCDGSLAAVAYDTVRTLGSHSLLNDHLFAELQRARPQSTKIGVVRTFLHFDERADTLETSTSMVYAHLTRLCESETQRGAVYRIAEFTACIFSALLTLCIIIFHTLGVIEVLLFGLLALALLSVAFILARRRHQIHLRLVEYLRALSSASESDSSRIESNTAVLFRRNSYLVFEYLTLLGVFLIACFTIQDICVNCCHPVKALIRVSVASVLMFLDLAVCQRSRRPLLDYFDVAADRQIRAEKHRYLRRMGRLA